MGLMQLLFGKTIDRRIAEYQKELNQAFEQNLGVHADSE